MSISPKTITVFLDGSPSGRRRATHAASLARRWKAHVVGVHLTFAGVELPAFMSNARGTQALRQVVAYKQQREARAETVATELRGELRALCERLAVSGEFYPIGRDNTSAQALGLALHSDLVIVGQPEPSGLPEHLSLQKLLLESGAPLLIVPNAWEGETIGSRIVVGWNETREARRAIVDAMAFLTAARAVTVLTIDPSASDEEENEAAGDIAVQLRRHGAVVDHVRLPSKGFSIPAILLGYAEQCNSDLLVVGAYSHARLKEALFGGTTRTLLAHTPIPTLLSK
jgi:nucleotide-binding universal stress UspA family protein